MADPVQIFFVSPLRSGTTSIQGWGNSSNSEIVAHAEVMYPDQQPSTWWHLSHRRSGLNLRIGHFESRGEALRVAAEIEEFPEWKEVKVGRIEDGVDWNGVDQAALRQKMYDRHADYCARLRDSLESGSPSSAQRVGK